MAERQTVAEPPRPKRPILLAALVVLAWAGVVLLVIFRFGWPARVATWIAVLAGAVLPFAAVPMRGRRKRGAMWLAYGFYGLFLLFPFETDSLLDFHSGRSGVDATLIWEFGPVLRYHRDGPNTAILEHHLGRRGEAWNYAGLRSTLFGFGRWRDGADVTVENALIGDRYLPKVLDRLPDDRAKTRVLTCLSDPANVARVHQEQLLLMLWVLGYPEGHDATSWWRQHESIFRPEPDAAEVARLVWGLRDRFVTVLGGPADRNPARRHLFVFDMQLLRGSVIGGDSGLRVAILQRQVDQWRLDPDREDEAPEDAWIHRIAWWPAGLGRSATKGD